MILRRAVLASSVVLLASAQRSLAEEPYEIVVSKNVMIPMRDGVKLATDVYRPARNGVPVSGRFPVILERTPYGKDSIAGWAAYFVPRGYVAVGQDTRGRWGSEGRWRLQRDDPNDGYDTAKWIGEQAWCDGGIGTVGTSYPGATQHALAISNPPYLKTMIPVDAMSNTGRYGVRHNGAFELRFLNWMFALGFAIDGPNAPRTFPGIAPEAIPELRKAYEHVRDYAKALPLRAGTTPLKLAPDYEAWLVEAMRHGDNDDYWKSSGPSVVDHLAEYKDIPVYHVSGWYDSWGTPVANLNYVELSKTKKSLQRLMMGPWTHGGQTRTYSGEAEFGPQAAIDFNAFRQRWFDRWLKGIENGVDKEPPVRVFVMGDGDGHKTSEGRVFVGGHWREEREWPPARAKATPYYLRADGVLSAEKPAANESPSRYLFDPKHPVPTLGGNVSSEGTLITRGAMDQRCRPEIWMCEDTRPLSARNDVLVYQTPLLKEDVEVTGRLIVKLWASSSAPDTDFTAKLVDVYPGSADFPGGIDLNVGDSIVRARYRNSLAKAEMMKPGEVYELTIEMYPTSLVFRKGHRIRLDVSSSNFPRFDVNPNTGEPLNDNRRWAVAENAVYHEARHPSHIVLPVIPRANDARP